MKNITSFLISVYLCIGGGSLTAQTVIKNLRVEYQKNPIGLDVIQPRFSWEMESTVRGASQTAYEISISTDQSDNNVIWSSERVFSDNSVHIRYNGRTLDPATRYYWKVDVWDQNNEKVSTTEPAYSAFFETGLMNSGWSNAKWLKNAITGSSGNLISRYAIDLKFSIASAAAGFIFGTKDKGNFYLWQINIEKTAGRTYFRPHVCRNGNYNVWVELDITSIVNVNKNEEHALRIEIIDKIARTYIDGYLIDERPHPDGVNYGYGELGFRSAGALVVGGCEDAYYDDIKVTNTETGEVLFETDFSAEDNGRYANAAIVNGKLHASDCQLTWPDDFLTAPSLFRSKFELNKEIRSAKIYTSALGVYDLFINGQRVGTPNEDGEIIYDEFKPGYTDYAKTVFYTTYDVTGLLKKGANTIGAQVSSGWWNGEISFGKFGNASVEFIAKLVAVYADGTSKIIVTNPQTWKSSDNGPVRDGDIYRGESYDARLESEWKNVEYDDSGWNFAAEVNDFKGVIKTFIGPTVQIRPELERSPIGITKYKGTKATGTTYGEINVTETYQLPTAIALQKGETLIYDLGQNMVGWVKFKVKGNAGVKMRVRFAEMLNDNGSSQRNNDGPGGSIYQASLRGAKASLYYKLKGDGDGEAFHPSTSFFGFRYCEVTATEAVEIESLVGEVVGTATQEGSSFVTSHDAVNQLCSNIKWSQRGNFLSVPTDCPQRDERLGWTADAQVFSRTAAYNADVAAFYHKWMGDMRDGQRADGAFPDIAPYNWDTWGAAAWSDAGIIIPWNTYLVYNDIGILEENYAAMEKHMAFLAKQSGSGYLYNGGLTTYGDWLAYASTDSRYISVCYYAYVTLLMEKISNALSKNINDIYAQKAASYKTLYNQIKAEFQGRYVNANSGSTLKINTQTAYLLALKNNLFRDEENRKAAVLHLEQLIKENGNKLSTGFVGTGTLNQTLSDMELNETAYNLLLQRANPSWLYSVDQGATTTWERWNSYTKESGFGDAGMNSFNHYSYGAVMEWMYRYMAGINPDEKKAGFKHIILTPTPDLRQTTQDRITKTDATYDSYYGKIKSAWEIDDQSKIKYYQVTVPANTTATLTLTLNNDNDKVYENGVIVNDAEGVIRVSPVENKKIVLDLLSGSYFFEIKNPSSINDPLKPSASIHVYPNPAVDNLIVEGLLNNTSVSLNNMHGQKLLQIHPESGKINLSLATFPSGIYILQIVNEQGENSSKKIIVR